MNSSTSNFSSGTPNRPDLAHAYDALHPAVQAWVWYQGWRQLRTFQAEAIPPILSGDVDVIVSAATASGKTEAAWLPICSALAFDLDEDDAQPGVKALYISPLKALINDQYGRLQDLAAAVDLPTYRRHGDVTGTDRTALMKNPDGLLLITPESLEALFVNQGSRVPWLLNGLRYVVVDELHSFIGTERGAQLQSLLHRIELAIRRRVPRIALSATLADPSIAAEFLRPGDGQSVTTIADTADGSELQMILRGYVSSPPSRSTPPIVAPPLADEDDEVMDDDDASDDDDGGVDDTVEMHTIAENIYKQMRGKDNLVFANSRQNVELYTDILVRMSEERHVPNEFFAHHGNLSKEHREDVEQKLKSHETHATAICTSTLEMGIDIGSADTIGQIGAPSSVSALRQRLGRSGRRGSPAILRMYVIERDLDNRTSLLDQLRIQTVQTIAVVELLLERWYEPPNTSSLHLSTLIQQILSVIAQHGGANAAQLFSALCADGPFVHVTRDQFLRLLHDLGAHDLISQASDGTLLPGGRGEKLVNHYSFYTAFQTAQEYRLVAHGRTIGSIPIDFPLATGGYLIFAGRRWRILAIDNDVKVIELKRARGGRPPQFGGSGFEIADGIRQKMRSLYENTLVPAYLSATSQRLLDEGRAAYSRLHLHQSPLYPASRTTTLFLWHGDVIVNTIAVALKHAGLEVSQFGPTIECRATPDRLTSVINHLIASPQPAPTTLAKIVEVKERDKHDIYLSAPLLTEAYAARSLDVPSTWRALRALSQALKRSI